MQSYKIQIKPENKNGIYIVTLWIKTFLLASIKKKLIEKGYIW